MSEGKKVKLEVPKSLLVVLWIVAIGLMLNGVQPFLSAPANAVGGVQKVQICASNGLDCVGLTERKTSFGLSVGYALPVKSD